MRRFRVAVLVAAAAALAAATAGCGSKPVAKVNGQVITEQQFCEALQTGRTNAPVARNTLDQMITRRLVAEAVRKQKITVTEAELGQARAQYQQMTAYQQGWLPLIQGQLATDQDVDKEIELALDLVKLFIKHDELVRFFEQNRSKFDRKATAVFQRIGFKTQAEAARVRVQIASNKATFEQVARERLTDPATAAETGQVQVAEDFSRGHNPELESLVFKTLKLNQLSQPIQVSVVTGQTTPDQQAVREAWWELIQVVQRTPSIPATWDNSWFAVMQQVMVDPAFVSKVATGLDKLRADATLEIFSPKFNSLSQQYDAIKRQQPPAFGGPSKTAPPAPGKAAAPAPGKAAPPGMGPSKAPGPGGR